MAGCVFSIASLGFTGHAIFFEHRLALVAGCAVQLTVFVLTICGAAKFNDDLEHLAEITRDKAAAHASEASAVGYCAVAAVFQAIALLMSILRTVTASRTKTSLLPSSSNLHLMLLVAVHLFLASIASISLPDLFSYNTSVFAIVLFASHGKPPPREMRLPAVVVLMGSVVVDLTSGFVNGHDIFFEGSMVDRLSLLLTGLNGVLKPLTALVLFFHHRTGYTPPEPTPNEAVPGKSPPVAYAPPPQRRPLASAARSPSESAAAPLLATGSSGYGAAPGVIVTTHKPTGFMARLRSRLGFKQETFVSTAPPVPVAVTPAAAVPASAPAKPQLTTRMEVDVNKYKTAPTPAPKGAVGEDPPLAVHSVAPTGTITDPVERTPVAALSAPVPPVEQPAAQVPPAAAPPTGSDDDDDDSDSDEGGAWGFEAPPAKAAERQEDEERPIFEAKDDSIFGAVPAGRAPRGPKSTAEKKKERAARREAKLKAEADAIEAEKAALEAEEARLEVQKFFSEEAARKERESLAARQQAELLLLKNKARQGAGSHGATSSSDESAAAPTESAVRHSRSKSVERSSSGRRSRSQSRGRSDSTSAGSRSRSNSTTGGARERSTSLTRSGSASNLSRSRSGSLKRSGSSSSLKRSGSTTSLRGMELRHTSVTSLSSDTGWTCPGCGKDFADVIIGELHRKTANCKSDSDSD